MMNDYLDDKDVVVCRKNNLYSTCNSSYFIVSFIVDLCHCNAYLYYLLG